MRKFRIIGMAFVAMLALGAMMVSSASAEVNSRPYFSNEKCVKVAKGAGHYSNSTCTTVSEGGEFELEALAAGGGGVTFTSKSGLSLLVTTSGATVECEADTNTGKLTGPTTDEVTVTFTKCKTTIGGMNLVCGTKGAAAGTIVTNLLSSKLGFIKKGAPTEVGDSLSPKTPKTFATFECSLGGVTVATIEVGEGAGKGGDSVIGKITPLNTSTANYTLTFKCATAPPSGVQEFTKFEGGALDVLESSTNGGAFERACEQSTDNLTLSVSNLEIVTT